MEKYFNYMEKMGWNNDYSNIENLEFEYKIVEKYYIEEIEKSSKADATECIGFLLDFIKSVIETNKK